MAIDKITLPDGTVVPIDVHPIAVVRRSQSGEPLRYHVELGGSPACGVSYQRGKSEWLEAAPPKRLRCRRHGCARRWRKLVRECRPEWPVFKEAD